MNCRSDMKIEIDKDQIIKALREWNHEFHNSKGVETFEDTFINEADWWFELFITIAGPFSYSICMADSKLAAYEEWLLSHDEGETEEDFEREFEYDW